MYNAASMGPSPCEPNCSCAFSQEFTDLTAQGHYTQISQYTHHKRSWRFRGFRLDRPTRRSTPVDEDSIAEATPHQLNSNRGLLQRLLLFFRCLRCGAGARRSRKRRIVLEDGRHSFGFSMTSGPKRFFQRIVWEYPLLAMCIWVFLFLCEGVMVALYVAQATSSPEVTWALYIDEEFSWYFYTQSILSFMLLSQLVFAYSMSLTTIVVVLLTSIYQIVSLIVAIFFHMGWFSRVYVPLFLRCWPMRQYLLLLLDSLAMLMPRNDRLDLVRNAAGPLSLFFVMAFSSSCIFHIHQVLRGFPISMIDALYWLMVTVSTVGFGDVVPQGYDGRLIAIVIIFVFLAKMPSWIMVVGQTLRLLRKFPRYTGRRDHFLVFGYVNHEDAVSILEEVITLYPWKSVCFCNNNDFPLDVIAIGRHPRYKQRSSFMRIGVLDKRTLQRMRVREAAALIILPTSDVAAAARDGDVMLSSIVFQRHAPHVQQYLRLRFGLHVNLLSEHKTVMIDQHMKTIMATALLLPGVVPFLVNLVRISSGSDAHQSAIWHENDMENWKGQYEYSRRNIFGTCPVPWYFVHLSLMQVVSLMKKYNVLVMGVEEGSRKLMRLDLEYQLENDDVLLVLYERGSDNLTRALQALEPKSVPITALSNPRSPNISNCSSLSLVSRNLLQQDLVEHEMSSNTVPIKDTKLFYPFSQSFDRVDTAGDNEGGPREGSSDHVTMSGPERATLPSATASRSLKLEQSALNNSSHIAKLYKQLMGKEFVNKEPLGIPLAKIPLGDYAPLLGDLLSSHDTVSKEVHCASDRTDRLERKINDIIAHLANYYFSGAEVDNDTECFLFIDQVSSFKKPPMNSLYDQYLNEAVSRYELLQMMQCIRAIHSHSRLTLLGAQTLDDKFLHWCNKSFGFPMRYIRGLSTMESHLDYALKHSGGVMRLRGILLHCSQLGYWDFADVPLITVENNIRTILDQAVADQKTMTCPRRGEDSPGLPEQNVVVELKSFKSCISVTPHHTDEKWRRRGEKHFQDSLAFMMGRCFSTNMLQTIFIHAHRDRRIMQFFEMVLCLQQKSNPFDLNAWSSLGKTSPTLFHACGNTLLQFKTFGDAFSFLLTRRLWVVIGVFRQFPEFDKLQGRPRYFITNPPLDAPLYTEDVLYALSVSPTTERE